MEDPDKLEAAMGAVRDQLLAVLARHEREAHGGRACMSNRASAIGFLAHCLGVRGSAWRYAEDRLVWHDLNCKAGSCVHHPEGGTGDGR
jgi:hypothetical protein